LAIDTTPSFVRVSGSCIKRSLPRLLASVGELLAHPSFPEAELAQLKRESEATLLELMDNDQALASMHLRRALFRGHPYGRPVLGTRASLARVELEQVVERYRRELVARPRLFGFAGAITEREAEALVAQHLARAPEHTRHGAAPRVPEPVMPPGRRLRIVDKPERTQTQIQIGRLGSHPHDDDHVALLVGNAVFGGAFTARLMRAVRSERGWSYGASSRLGLDRVREAWSMWTFPAAADAAACIELQLALMRDWVERGIDESELGFAKSYLIKSHAFSVDTADKRLEQAVEIALYDLPRDYYSAFTANVEAVTRDEVNAALRRRLSPDDLVLAVVATDAELGPALRAAARAESCEVVPFDADAQE
ncbi:MAG TPA: pitrilysin family protein, partial [Polyangiaceae bacterium]|nr:pitrilysin family protein [Polyangiaceae bacterium]